MTMTIPVPAFQIGQRVQVKGQQPFVIRSMFLGWDEVLRYAGNIGYDCFEANKLTLAPERPPYVASERLVMSRELDHRFNGLFPHHYRCETDAEMAERHAIEHAAYDAQGDGA